MGNCRIQRCREGFSTGKVGTAHFIVGCGYATNPPANQNSPAYQRCKDANGCQFRNFPDFHDPLGMLKFKIAHSWPGRTVDAEPYLQLSK
jgi:hypothetical protein